MITLVVGGQYGSEGKGSVVSWIAKRALFDLVIRTGSPNAGHTFKAVADDGSEKLYKMRQLPCTWAAQKETPIYIPAGAVINKTVFFDEVAMVREAGYKGKIYVSPQAALIDEESIEQEKVEIATGTTGEGVGATRAKKCLRAAQLVKDDSDFKLFIGDFYPLHAINNYEKQILIEATQGFGLSLDGSRYPYVTSTNLTTYRVLDDAEIPFGVHEVNPWVVLRTFPIRIAGNSGPLFNETSWQKLREQFGSHIPDEQTTVTKKTRRVGGFDPSLVQEAVRRLGVKVVVLTFVDYVFPNIKETGITKEIRHWLLHMESMVGRRIDYLGVGIGELIPVGSDTAYTPVEKSRALFL